MLSSFKRIVPLILVSLTSAVSLPPSISVSENLTQAADTFDGTFPSLTTGKISCVKIWGTDLKEDSCRNAWDKMDHSSTQVERFVSRHIKGITNCVGLPFRYLSDDGICAIDVFFYRNSQDDFATRAVISEGAKMILDQCVISLLRGGSITHFSTYFLLSCYRTTVLDLASHCHSLGYVSTGRRKPATGDCHCELTYALTFTLYTGQNGHLFVAIRSYEPFVDCEPHPTKVPSEESCNFVLEEMPAGTRYSTFGTNKSDPDVRAHLPKTFIHGQ